MSLRELVERRAKVHGDLKQIVEAVERAGGDPSDEQRTQMDRLESEFNTLDSRIARQQSVDDMDRRMSGGTPVGGTGDNRLDAELENFSLVRAIASQVPDLAARVDSGREVELSNEVARRAGRSFQGMAVPNTVFRQKIERRVLTTTTPVDGPGSNLIRTDVRGDLYIDALYDSLVTRRLGARVLTGLVGNLAVPKVLHSSTAVWVEENSPIPLTDMAFGQVGLTPKHVGARMEIGRNMLLQPSADVESLVRADFGMILAGAVDAAAINGSGIAPVPRGILNTPGVTVLPMGANGGGLTWAAVLDLIGALEDNNVEGTGFAGNGKVSRFARQTLKSAGLPGYLMDAPGSLAGYPYASTNLVPSNGTKGIGTDLSALIFGRWSDLVIGYWSEFDLLVNPFESSAYARGNVQIRGMVTMDAAVRYPESFAAVTDLVTA